MLKPSASELMKMKKIDSKYTLVIATAKRARDILSTGVTFTDSKTCDKPVSVAVNEIAENKVTLKNKDDNSISDDETIMNSILENSFLAAKEDMMNEDA